MKNNCKLSIHKGNFENIWRSRLPKTKQPTQLTDIIEIHEHTVQYIVSTDYTS